jgi:AcrR family transcriptional regulator
MPSTRITDRHLRPRKLPRQQRSQATVEAILQAAAQVFERHGYAAGTTNRIAQRAGVSIGTVYQYFPNKDAILVALTRQHMAEGTAALQPHVQRLSAGASLEEVLADVVEAMVALHAMAPRLHTVLFEETKLPQALRAELQQLEDQLLELTAQALAAEPHNSSVDPRLQARIVIGAIEGLTHRLVLRPPPDVTSAEIAEEITELARSYVNSGR